MIDMTTIRPQGPPIRRLDGTSPGIEPLSGPQHYMKLMDEIVKVVIVDPRSRRNSKL